MKEYYLENLRQILTTDFFLDVGDGDITSELVDEDAVGTATIASNETAVLCGVDAVSIACSMYGLSSSVFRQDGDTIVKGEKLIELSGNMRKLLLVERTILNMLQFLSGTATITHRVVSWIDGHKARILDTRKTIPACRYLQKYAVLIGGAQNHRLNLSDEYLIKDNHIIASSLRTLLDRYESLEHKKHLVLEVESLDEYQYVVSRKIASRIMLDNFSISDIAKVMDSKPNIPIEVSGVPLDRATLVAIAELGVDFISLGSITKNISSVDFSMDMVKI